ncbi:hypothetical protein OQI_13915 [Streptomyces pharetrae CZA14]|uniref:Phosphatidic acid phosphatase type 2/haloperoxidase domain-containing protein n=1 Tax=Streptomyces pharetrae CZA14 TaxID=1144883 RepID=A0ABX3YJ26_9ACTN|nr:hypothetical protein OQI_13915 [Streptomyces pharetrae CZA14]
MPEMSRHRVMLFTSTFVFYAAIVWAVVTASWLVRLDWQLMFFRPYQQWPQVHAFADYYVVLGQRGPTAVMVAAWLAWRSWQRHTLRPLLTLAVSLLLLNGSVGAAKIGMGRLGPHYATIIGTNEMGLGGDCFPSGHTANAVVTWGIVAYLTTTPTARRWLSALSAAMALGVGLTTVYLGTHWLSDVLLGWAAGLLILLTLPWFEPLVARSEAWIVDLYDQLCPRGGAHRSPCPADSQVVLGENCRGEQEVPELDTVSPTASSLWAPVHPAPGGTTPNTPIHSHKPPLADGTPRTATSAARPCQAADQQARRDAAPIGRGRTPPSPLKSERQAGERRPGLSMSANCDDDPSRTSIPAWQGDITRQSP